MDKYAIIVAGGTGTRMGEKTPKQFLLLAGKPLIMHSIEAFHKYDQHLRILVAMHPDLTAQWNHICTEYTFSIPHQLVPGGKTRFHSVKNCLSAIAGNGLVAVHDSARPILTQELIHRTFTEASIFGHAIPCIPVNETVRRIEHGKVIMMDRTSLRIIQTPETFDLVLLKKAYEQNYQPAFTDDGSLLEAIGMQLHLVEGDHRNIKITLPGDIEIAEIFMQRGE